MNYLKVLLGKKLINWIFKPRARKDEHEEMAEKPTNPSLEAQLIRDEGLRLKPYKDSVGVLTIGIGHNLTRGISEVAAMFIFREDVTDARHEAETLPFYASLDDVRKDVIVNMVFNMGLPTFKRFKKMIAALEAKDYTEASKQMLASKWASQVGKRAVRLSKEMAEGVKIS